MSILAASSVLELRQLLAQPFTLDSHTWSVSGIDYILILGDRYYRKCIVARPNPDMREINTDYLAVTELVSKVMFNKSKVSIEVEYEAVFNGHIDNDNNNDGFPNLKNALTAFFREHTYGILTANSTSVAVYCINSEYENTTYWLLDSHSRGPKGYKAPSKGVACCMRFNDIDDLHKILRRNLYAKSDSSYILNVYSLTPLRMSLENRQAQEDQTDLVPVCSKRTSPTVVQTHNRQDETELQIICATSMLRSIDDGVPDLQNVVSVTNGDLENNQVRLVDIHRKTAPPLNLERERRIEELGWFFYFQMGKMVLGSSGKYITPLDYFQARIMSHDKRFHKTDYLFFALSVVEYFRAKTSVSVSCRMRQGEHMPQGLVDNMHLTIRNIRGSASYWKRCCSELIAMVRSLGPPTWFVTFSCNDLNWMDMLKALHIADGRSTSEENLPFSERLNLVYQQYPVVVARQFTIRVNPSDSFFKTQSGLLRRKYGRFLYRIEF